ncbi:hypothetical protein E4L95_16780 [Paracoccus liaowanqingii]|uniref:Uncharacterized protein n=1 Tax=Paracoccus liaowanqingii TaxID=2560053 RepID=A0A4Z1BI92_9RHOB|nr:hypothetical protein [Paracoccus liaowanqingii]TGN51518.1 hypothetical protein E4L95_16780 [Paracoccus liaowanqingii]
MNQLADRITARATNRIFYRSEMDRRIAGVSTIVVPAPRKDAHTTSELAARRGLQGLAACKLDTLTGLDTVRPATRQAFTHKCNLHVVKFFRVVHFKSPHTFPEALPNVDVALSCFPDMRKPRCWAERRALLSRGFLVAGIGFEPMTFRL